MLPIPFLDIRLICEEYFGFVLSLKWTLCQWRTHWVSWTVVKMGQAETHFIWEFSEWRVQSSSLPPSVMVLWEHVTKSVNHTPASLEVRRMCVEWEMVTTCSLWRRDAGPWGPGQKRHNFNFQLSLLLSSEFALK